LNCPNEYQRTLPTVTLGAVSDQPLGAVAPVVFAGVDGSYFVDMVRWLVF
jgi:hypothetical protein